MAQITESVDVAVPVRTAYDQWTQFEEFPRFMDGVEEVTQTDDTHLHWVAEFGGKREEWDAEITESVDVAVPVRVAYDQWTQFEEFPTFMEGVEQIRQIDDTHLHWVAEFGGKREEWDAEITEQHPDERVAWTARGGKGNAGVVTFHRLNDEETRVTVQMDWQPEGFMENVGAALGFDDRQVSKDLGRFKELVESRGTATDGWRGDIPA
jgi:uncharacterized membrane protein